MTSEIALPTDNYLTHTRGLWSWLFTLDHKRIGVMYLITITTAFLLGGIMAMLVRTELMYPNHPPAAQAKTMTLVPREVMSKDAYNKSFTLHGAVMIFLFILPGIPAAFGNFVLPIMLGAKDVAFPRLNLASLWLLWIGLVFFLIVLVFGQLDTGWTFYTPYSTSTETAVIPAVAGAFILGFSSIFTGLNFIVTIHTMRPPGMTWFKMPLFLWGLYGTALIQVLATPVLGITLALLAVERIFGLGIFDPKLGGDPVLFQHFFWFYSHPAVYIMILPAMGIISELITVFSHKHIFGYKFIAFSSIAIALLGFLVWGHHMFTSGQSILASMIFSVLTFSVSIPSAIKVFNWITSMYKGSISLATPMCYALMFIFLFGIGGLTGLFLGALATDMHLHNTYFLVAHFHYVMFGGTAVAFLGALHYWWPKMTGRMYSDFWGRVAVMLIFIGFNLTFIPQFLMGTHGMTRRYFDYSFLADAHPEIATYNLLSSLGSLVLAVGLFIIPVYLLGSLISNRDWRLRWYLVIVLWPIYLPYRLLCLFSGRKAPANPWGGATLEWQCSSPPPFDNFPEQPVVGDPYDFSRIEYDEKIDGYVRV